MVQAMEDDPATHFYALRPTSSNGVVGCAGFGYIDQRNRSAMLGMLIGDPSSRRKGLGTTALRMLLELGFQDLVTMALLSHEWDHEPTH